MCGWNFLFRAVQVSGPIERCLTALGCSMLRAVVEEIEVVPSSSSILREPAVACGHPFELGGGSLAAVVRSVVGARPKVERGAPPGASRGCLSAKVDRAGLGFEHRPSGAGRLSTPAKAQGLQRSWSGPELACEQSPSRKAAEAKSRPTRRLQRTPTAVSSYNSLRTESLRGALEACG